MLCECGAPMRGPVCQRGHRELSEAWSAQARAAALISRRRKEMADSLREDPDPMKTRVSEVSGPIKKMKPGESMSFDAPEGKVMITRAEKRLRGVSTYHVTGGGANVDPDLVRGDRHAVGHRGAAQEVAERLHNTGYADAAHSLELEEGIARAHAQGKAFHVKSLDGHKVSVSVGKGGVVHVQHHGKLPDSDHKNAFEAVERLKEDIRGDGGHFLNQDGSKDPLADRNPEKLTSDEVHRLLSDKEKFDSAAERFDRYRPAPDEPVVGVRDAIKDQVYDRVDDFVNNDPDGSRVHKAVADVSGLASPGVTNPEHLRQMADAVAQAHAHAQLAAMHLAPHVAAFAPHVARLVQSARAAANDLEEALSSGESQRIVKTRGRAAGVANLLEMWLGELTESPQTATLSVTHAPIGKGGKNWITRTKPGNTGQLPAYIQNIRNAIMRGGKTESEATSIAVGTVKRWARGGGKVSAEVRAASAKAVAEWEKLRGTSAAEKAAKKS